MKISCLKDTFTDSYFFTHWDGEKESKRQKIGKIQNTYILPWSACETLWTDLSSLTFFSLARKRRKVWGTNIERRVELIRGSKLIRWSLEGHIFIIHHQKFLKPFTLYPAASPQLAACACGESGWRQGIDQWPGSKETSHTHHWSITNNIVTSQQPMWATSWTHMLLSYTNKHPKKQAIIIRNAIN